ncbi:MAG: DNA mismatch repair protein MutS [Defluviitaleaceae bacterium]|nr:DNA mismatch repair protein MutS [Defluviitaleaceae bacterium]
MTPMFKQYLEIKEKYSKAILFFRLGDFYEMFFEDAQIASKELGLVLTSRDAGKKDGKKAPMCGIPYHSADNYIARLVKKGYHVAICEQITEAATQNKLVKREVVRVITPGTVTEENLLDSTKNNYILAVSSSKTGFGVAVADITTGEFQATSYPLEEDRKVIDEIAKHNPAEIVVRENLAIKPTIESIFGIKPTIFLPWAFEHGNAYKALCDHFSVKNLQGFGLEDNENAVQAAGALLEYLNQTQMRNLGQIGSIKKQVTDEFMFLDISSRNNLELVKTQRTNEKRGSLLWVLDKTVNPMGARLIRKWIEEPLLNTAKINARLDAIEELFGQPVVRAELREFLGDIKDIERLVSKIVIGSATPHHLLALKSSLKSLPAIKQNMTALQAPMIVDICHNMDTLPAIFTLIDNHISEEGEGIIKPGVSDELDSYRQAKTKGVDWLMEIEEEERQITGIKGLKVKFSRVFGYCIEVTNSYKDLVPDYYIRRQTLAAAERYITPKLKEVEEKILGAEENINSLEQEIFKDLLQTIAAQAQQLADTAAKIATIDVLATLAEIATKNNYIRPTVNTDGAIEISQGRHPVVEQLLDHAFVPNDTTINMDDRICVITGPNMAGKSTYMRGVALITLMAQMGSFVPAKSATISVVDRIFTRVGASDDLATGQSTFMVEMNEVANILNNATRNSLLILDEIGRGTSTYDGLCIAWAVLEHIANVEEIGAKTLFATHYHELTQIEGQIDGIKNYCVPVKEVMGELVFLRKVVPGSVDKSYGIQVARLSGIPKTVIDRANEIMGKLMQA